MVKWKEKQTQKNVKTRLFKIISVIMCNELYENIHVQKHQLRQFFGTSQKHKEFSLIVEPDFDPDLSCCVIKE